MSDWNSLAGLVTVEPITSPLAGPTYTGSFSSPFSASWSSTRELFGREVRMLEPDRVVIEAAFTPNQLRNDGLPRGGVSPASPGIVVRLVGTPHGDLRYEGTTYHDWQSNLRAIALSLEALRSVDRHGVTKRGEQYAGWKQLETGIRKSDANRGRVLIEQHGSMAAALKATHPDHGGDDADFRDVQAAKEAGA